MPTFEITGPDGTYEIDAPDEGTALQAFQKMNADPNRDLEYGEAPAGMVMDPETGRMMDTKAMANALPNRAVFSAPKGIPFIGQWFDEVVGAGDPVKTAVAREAAAQFERENPKTAMAAQVATGATAIPAAVIAGSAIAPATLPGQIAAGGIGSAITGAVEGAVSGYGAGTNEQDRADSAKRGAAIGATVGGVVGAAAPIVAKGARSIAGKAMDALTVNRNAADIGIDRKAADAVTSAMSADDALSGTGLANIAAAGDDAMLADSGRSARNLLDTAIQKSGPGSRLANAAVQKRAADASKRLRGTMDMVLGQPEGLNKAAKDIAQKTAAQRQMTYTAAYRTPIDYASEAGRKVEDVFSRTPPSIMRAAVSEANDAMLAAGERNMQILADIADDGTISFRQMPNMRQVDELKRALGTVAAKEVDQFGRPTAAGIRAGKLARELRDAAGDAVPVYKKAVQLGGDKIAEDRALQLGNTLLSPSVTRETVKEAVDGITEAERKQIALGLRQRIDDTMANVSKVISDPNLDAREAMKVWRDLSSRATREKVAVAVGPQRAKALFAELDRAESALGLKAAVADNSKTFVRTATDQAVKAGSGQDSLTYALRRGEGLNAGKRAIQAVTGATDQAAEDANQKVYEDIAKLLTGPRGADAQAALQSLMSIYQTVPQNAVKAQAVGRGVSGALTLPAYELGSQGVEYIVPPPRK